MSFVTIPRALRRALRPAALCLIPAVLAACAAGDAGAPGPSTETSPPPAAADDFAKPPAPLVTDRGEIFNVTINTFTNQVLVDKLEVEFNRRKGIHAFYGFYRDAYDRLTTIPFRDITRIDFLGQMPRSVYDQAIIGREAMNLHLKHAYELKVYFKDGRQEEFFAFIPKFRGERNLELWELSLDSNQRVFDFIEFNR